MAAGCGRRFSAGASPARRCNLERFLEATTPVVTPSCSSKVKWRYTSSICSLAFLDSTKKTDSESIGNINLSEAWD